MALPPPSDIIVRQNPKGDGYYQHTRDNVEYLFKIEDELYEHLMTFTPENRQDWWRAQILRINTAIDDETVDAFEFNHDGLPNE